MIIYSFFFQAEDGIRDLTVTGVQTCALPIFLRAIPRSSLEAQGRSPVLQPLRADARALPQSCDMRNTGFQGILCASLVGSQPNRELRFPLPRFVPLAGAKSGQSQRPRSRWWGTIR